MKIDTKIKNKIIKFLNKNGPSLRGDILIEVYYHISIKKLNSVLSSLADEKCIFEFKGYFYTKEICREDYTESIGIVEKFSMANGDISVWAISDGKQIKVGIINI